MVIYTQNADLVNFDKICKIGTYGLETDDAQLYALVGLTKFFEDSDELPDDGTNIILGVYDLHDKADAVLFELMKAFAIGKHVFEMPFDDEVDVVPPHNDKEAKSAEAAATK